jgi:hypothetical protein
MEIISHRGYWTELHERNQRLAFHRSFDSGFGTETDIRDFNGRLLISHDMPKGNEMDLDDLLEIMGERNFPLAINVKSAGLAKAVAAAFAERGHTNWFVFDMAVPDMRNYLAEGVSTYTRYSDEEPSPAWLEKCTGVWLDHFGPGYHSNHVIVKFLNQGKKVCVVSPELHGREVTPVWDSLYLLKDLPDLMLCTDRPEQAHEFFVDPHQTVLVNEIKK